MRTKALSKAEREIQIVTWFALRIQHDNESYASIYEIARGLGMSPSMHLANIVKGLVERGVLEDSAIARSGRWKGRGYMLKEGTFQRPLREPRKLKINHNGITQMELFE